MSAKLDDIDLNSDVVPVETSCEVNKATLLVSTSGTLMEPSRVEGGFGGSSIDGVVDEVRVSVESKEDGFGNSWCGGEAEMEVVDRGSESAAANASVPLIVGFSDGKEAGIGGGTGVNDIGGSSIDGGVDEVRVSVESKAEEGFVNRWYGGETEAEVVDRGSEGEAVNAAVPLIDGFSDGEEAVVGGGIGGNDGGIDLGLKDEVARLDLEVNENYRTSLVELGVDRDGRSNFTSDEKEEKVMEIEVYRHSGHESDRISLVVDLNSCHVADKERKSENGIGDKGTEARKLSGDVGVLSSNGFEDNECRDNNGEDGKGNQDAVIKELVSRTEKEGEFYVSDLVWGKVRSHPWWPGQIFDPSASSEKAKKYFKKDSFLIAYFGDQSFAWNYGSQIKPFQMHFAPMEKQSNVESFCHAVNCALDEVSRRVEFGLSCSCLSEEVYAKIKSQVVVNAGIRNEPSRIDGGDSFFNAASYIPTKLVQHLKALAKAPFGGTDRLEFVIARAQLVAFNRWKGYYQLSTLEMFDGLLENDTDVPVLGKDEGPDEVIEDAIPASKGDKQVSSGKGKSVIRDSSSRKRKSISGDGVRPSKKEKRLSDLMSESCSSLPNGVNKAEEKAGRKLSSSSSVKNREAVDSISNDSRVKRRKSSLSSRPVNKMSSPPKKLFRVGERIRRVVSQLSGSTPVLKQDDKTSNKMFKNVRKFARAPYGVSDPRSEKSQGVKCVPAEYPPAVEMLSQLSFAARDPMNGHSFLTSLVSFFSDFRKSSFLENSNLRKDKKSNVKVSGTQTGKNSSNSETTEMFGFEGIEDSYWTDRIIQGNPEEQVLFEPETAIDPSPELDHKQETVVNLEQEAEKLASYVDEKFQECSPTALILNFTDLDSVPSEANLNKIFKRYGPLNESETEVLQKSKRAKVVFKRRSDAETAFSSAGKFSIFGPSLVSYRLNYTPTPRKASTPAKRTRKDASTKKAMKFED